MAVDGAFEARGLELSHWPGHRTPPELRHELSTGCALRFAELPDPRRDELAAGALEIVNNHYDTDGTCALFAARHPRRALALRAPLLAAARSGDFFRATDDAAFRADCAVQGLTDPERSPLAERLRGLDGAARWQLATHHWMERLDALLEGDDAPYRALWERELEDLRADRAALAAAERADEAALDLTSWTAPAERRAFDPGRHALFGATERDRALAIGVLDGAWTYRLVFSTLSWFETPDRERRPRGDLERLALALNEAEGSGANDAERWRAQPAGSPAPEVWFGGEVDEMFAEHNRAPRPSALAPSYVLRSLREHLG